MTTTLDLAHHSPGLADGWARFDGPAGTNALGTITDVSGITAAAEFLLAHDASAAAEADPRFGRTARLPGVQYLAGAILQQPGMA